MLPRPPRSTLFPYTTLVPICTDPALDPREIIEAYFQRWDIEVNFCDEKTLLGVGDRKSTRLNSSHRCISYAVFCSTRKSPAASPLLYRGANRATPKRASLTRA